MSKPVLEGSGPKTKAVKPGGLCESKLLAKTKSQSTPAILVVSDIANGPRHDLAAGNVAVQDCGPGREIDRFCEAMASSCGDSEGRAGNGARPSQLPAAGCSDLLHELSNLVTGVLLNAQVLEWKLPPYSHLKRPVREVARSAQRSSELMKRLLRRCSEGCEGRQPATSSTVKGRKPLPNGGATAPTSGQTCGVALLAVAAGDLTAACDLRTSDGFPKRDDRYER